MITTETEIIKTLQEEILQGNSVRLHISQIDYNEDFEYDVLCGIYVSGELKHTFELENTTNKKVETFKQQVNTEIDKFRNLYLI